MNIANKIIESLTVLTTEGKKFKTEDFILCFDEELQSCKDYNNKFVNFKLQENGQLVYDGIYDTSLNTPQDICISINSVINKESLNSDNQVDIFEMLSAIMQNYHKDRKRVLENLDSISCEFDKKLLEVTKIPRYKLTPDPAKLAEEYLNLDIATKKQKLLEKLLGSN